MCVVLVGKFEDVVFDDVEVLYFVVEFDVVGGDIVWVVIILCVGLVEYFVEFEVV